MTADVVVAGTGGAGFAAATTARSNGASVIMLEKGAIYGGTTAKSGGEAVDYLGWIGALISNFDVDFPTIALLGGNPQHPAYRTTQFDYHAELPEDKCPQGRSRASSSATSSIPIPLCAGAARAPRPLPAVLAPAAPQLGRQPVGSAGRTHRSGGAALRGNSNIGSSTTRACHRRWMS
jgi:choline dehydrogenase-like flavoprotein